MWEAAAAVKCVPPGDRPAKGEFRNCSVYLDAEIAMMKNLKAVLALGSLAFGAYLDHLSRRGAETGGARFAHGRTFSFEGSPVLYASYHPSPRNTNTGRLTSRMLTSLLKQIRKNLELESRV